MDCDIVSYHIDSFNFLADEGLQLAAENVPAVKARLPNGDAVEFSYTSARLGVPLLENVNTTKEIDQLKIYPAECRQRGLTYRAPLRVNINLKINGRLVDSIEHLIGEVPVMLKSNRCNLYGLNSEELIKRGEERIEKGGYFICKGSEKVMRLLVGTKRNFPLAVQRRSLKDKGALFSEHSIMMRCIRGNHSASMINLHYLESAAIVISLQFRREIFYIPLMYVLKSLTSMNDMMIYEQFTSARPGDSFWAGCITNMLAMAQDEGIVSQQAALLALGSRFRIALDNRIAPWETDEDVARYLLKYCVAIHLDSDIEKFYCISLMAQKLIALVKGEIAPESQDNPQFQETLVSGHMILAILRERLENVLFITRKKIDIMASRKPDTFHLTTKEFMKALGNSRSGEITRGLEYFLATGNLATKVGIGIMQETGFSVIAERINQLRFVSHFRAIHRGAFFMEMRTTDVRKLRPEAWGFICPVHTPDGAPCGLLNHVTASCRIVTHYQKTQKLPALLLELGMITHESVALVKTEPLYPVILDGNFLGYIPRKNAAVIERQLRVIKIDEWDERVPKLTEITLIRHSTDPTNVMTQFPGLYLYTLPGRMYRPVRNIAFDVVEYIGIFEQVYLSIIIKQEEAELGVTMHQELHPSTLFSFAGNLIPFPDHNQSPRNVYQCQMGKQTMGVPVHAWKNRADNKMYWLQYPQKPLLKLAAHDKYEMDEYPLGTNACVAVISYTGYDMEDAMVINRGSFQRGFAHGTVVKVERINLVEKRGFATKTDKFFLAEASNKSESIDEDGLPIQGRIYHEGDIYYSVFNTSNGTYTTHRYKYSEPAYCGLVRIVEDEASKDKTHALIQWRISRNPIIGDKFASRHGQKGINSFLWPSESMPFSETGMVPDIIFNPHGFPSRMTIGMMIESMAGKAAAMHGASYDASPFVYNEKNTAIDHFGDLLNDAGFNYHGNETLYSGIDGREMEVQIFFGIVYYQRLRHMIADKFQVRATGPVDPVTLQPVKGRKKGGGIRFGEMERDALIAHGSAFCLQVNGLEKILKGIVALKDRLFNCSDRDEAFICARCGSILSVMQLKSNMAMHRRNELRTTKGKNSNYHNLTRKHCSICKKDDKVYLIQIPRVFRYLCAELSAVNMQIKLNIEHPKDLKY